MFKHALHPDRYHGSIPMQNFFEGWYFKMVTGDGKRAIALIPGIFWGKTEAEHHSFLQVLDGRRVTYEYVRGPWQAFQAADDPFAVVVDKSRFSFSEVAAAAHTGKTQLEGTVQWSNVRRWPGRWFAPGSMGPYNFVPRLQCYAQVCITDAVLSGSMRLNGEQLDFSGGRGYVEKNWGSAFPYSWIWIQSNNFSDPSLSVTCSIGHIPFGPGSFRGHLIGVSWKNQFYAFTTQNRSRLSIQSFGSDVRLQMQNRRYRLELTTKSSPDAFILCMGPRDGTMVPMVEETLQGTVQLSLWDQKQQTLLIRDVGRCTGIEYGGEQQRVLDQDG